MLMPCHVGQAPSSYACTAGCLWTWPGSQKAGVQRRFKRKQDDSVWFDGEQTQYDLEKFVPLEVRSDTERQLGNLHVPCCHSQFAKNWQSEQVCIPYAGEGRHTCAVARRQRALLTGKHIPTFTARLQVHACSYLLMHPRSRSLLCSESPQLSKSLAALQYACC